MNGDMLDDHIIPIAVSFSISAMVFSVLGVSLSYLALLVGSIIGNIIATLLFKKEN